jgi:hypothetical protein
MIIGNRQCYAGSLAMLHSRRQELEDGIPDLQALSMQEIDSLPGFVRAFECNGSIEHYDPSLVLIGCDWPHGIQEA